MCSLTPPRLSRLTQEEPWPHELEGNPRTANGWTTLAHSGHTDPPDFRTDYLGTPTPVKLYYLRPVFIGCPKLLAVLRLAGVYGRAGSVGRIGYELELAPSPDAFNALHLFLSLVTCLADSSLSLRRLGKLLKKRRDSCLYASFSALFFLAQAWK